MQTQTHTSDTTAISAALGTAAHSLSEMAAATAVNEWLTFRLAGEEYGIDILSVQEIRSYERPTRMVNTPAMVKGVVNLRGVIVPIVDMRIQFNLPEVEYNEFTVVIVLNVGKLVVGMVIDSVSDVITLQPSQIKPVPHLTGGQASDHLIGIGNLEQRTLLLLDIEHMLTSEEMGLIAPTVQ